MNAEELFEFIDSLAGARPAGAGQDGVLHSRLLNGVEYALARESGERKLRASWKRRQGGGGAPLLLVVDDPGAEGRLQVLGPSADGPLRVVRAESMRDLIAQTPGMGGLEAVRHLAGEIDRLDSTGVAGLTVRGLGTEHLFRTRLPTQARWQEMAELAPATTTTEWRDLLERLGYSLTRLPKRGYLATASGRPIIVVHPKGFPSDFARLDENARLPEGALLADCDAHGAAYGLLASKSRMRLLRAVGDPGQATSYLEIDAALLDPEHRPLLALLGPRFLAEGGLEELLAEARDYGSALRLRLDRALRQEVLPVLGIGLGRWATGNGIDPGDDARRAELEAAALTFVFRLLFLLYAESAGYLPMSNHTYGERSMTRVAARAAEELDAADPGSTSLWRDITGLVEAMRNGQRAWGVPAYNGALFAPAEFDGAEILERASIPDAQLAPALVALARDPVDPDVGVDFSGLEIGHLGHIYEGLLSLRLSVADRDLTYDPGADRYRPIAADDETTQDDDGAIVRSGELLWLTNEGGRKGGGVYYTRAELVRHVVRQSVRPAFADHLAEVRVLAESDRSAAAGRLFDFYVLDPACGSGHFLVEVVNELADQIATLLGDLALPELRTDLEGLRRSATTTLGVEVEDAALLRRLVLKRCVYGVDLSPMGAEIAKISLWLATFVPGLSLAYLDHNVQVGNSLIGIADPDELAPPEEQSGTIRMFDDELISQIRAAGRQAAKLRQLSDRTPAEVRESHEVGEALRAAAANAERIFDLWVAEPLGLAGARAEVNHRGDAIVAGQNSLLADRAGELARSMWTLHWPLVFAEAFDRERPGFDVVVGNPPWEEVNVEELGFYARYRPGIRSLSEVPRADAIAKLLLERPELTERLEIERVRLLKVRGYLGPASGYRPGPGNADLYEFFCQRYQQLLRGDGRLGVVLPRSTFLAKGSANFRAWLFDEATPTRVDFLLNAGRWAFDAEPRYTIALLAGLNRPSGADETFEAAGVAASATEFATQTSSKGLELKRDALGPALEIPLLSDQRSADLLAKLRDGDAFALGSGRWQCFPVQGDFNETSDRSLWREATEGWSLWKGQSFDQFDPHGTEERVCPPGEEALAKVRKPRPGSGSLLAETVPLPERRVAVARTVERARVAFRDVTNRTNSRTVIACLVPPEHFLLNSAPYLAFIDDDPHAEAACLALMNSLVFDWQARRFVETHVNFYVLEGLRLPPLDDATFGALATASARLSCVDERYADFAKALSVPTEELGAAERLELRADIDARVARVWELTEAELEIVFGDFTEAAVDHDYRQAVRDRFAELG